uniref:Variant surface glycoprotein 1125.4993 n=1 Tax=Trypanosoma brucei TaxID=5691 RepID=A0A1J0RBI5_9TRYP|nr:variant surface glycoprotein 1125.4993 [Trypanosoma brucei]
MLKKRFLILVAAAALILPAPTQTATEPLAHGAWQPICELGAQLDKPIERALSILATLATAAEKASTAALKLQIFAEKNTDEENTIAVQALQLDTVRQAIADRKELQEQTTTLATAAAVVRQLSGHIAQTFAMLKPTGHTDNSMYCLASSTPGTGGHAFIAQQRCDKPVTQFAPVMDKLTPAVVENGGFKKIVSHGNAFSREGGDGTKYKLFDVGSTGGTNNFYTRGTTLAAGIISVTGTTTGTAKSYSSASKLDNRPTDDLVKAAAYDIQQMEDYDASAFKTAELEIIKQSATADRVRPILIKLLTQPTGEVDKDAAEKKADEIINTKYGKDTTKAASLWLDIEKTMVPIPKGDGTTEVKLKTITDANQLSDVLTYYSRLNNVKIRNQEKELQEAKNKVKIITKTTENFSTK